MIGTKNLDFYTFPDNVDVAGLWTSLLSSQNLDKNLPSLILELPVELFKIPVPMTSSRLTTPEFQCMQFSHQ